MKKIFYVIILAGLSVLTACKKESLVEDTKYDIIPASDPTYTYLKFLDVTPGSPTLNFYVDGAKFSAGLSSTGVENAGYSYTAATSLFPDLGYAIASPGTKKITAKIIPSATADPSLEVLNTTINAAAGKYYSIFTSGVYSSTNKSVGPLLVLEDARPSIDTTKLVVRVINLYNGGPNVDFIRTSNGAKVASNVAYGAASAWTDVPMNGGGPAPSFTYTVNNSSTNVVLGTLTTGLTKGRAYTIILRGVQGNVTYPINVLAYTTFY